MILIPAQNSEKNKKVNQKKRVRERERERGRQTDRQLQRQTVRKTIKQADRQPAELQTDRSIAEKEEGWLGSKREVEKKVTKSSRERLRSLVYKKCKQRLPTQSS